MEAPTGTTLHLDHTTDQLVAGRAELVKIMEAESFNVAVVEACAKAILLIDRCIAWQGEPS